MPFEQHLGASGARQLALAREVSKGYVPITAVAPSYKVLDAARQQTLSAWVDTLIPPVDPWPAPSQRGVPQYVDNCASFSGPLRQMLVAAMDQAQRLALQRFETAFADCEEAQRVQVLQQIEADLPADFGLILELTFEGYYRDRTVAHVVQDRTGFRVAGPLAGIPGEPFPEELLADVIAREKHYREVSEEVRA